MIPLPIMKMVQNQPYGCHPWWSSSPWWTHGTKPSVWLWSMMTPIPMIIRNQPYDCDPCWLPYSWWRWYKTICMIMIHADSPPHDEDGTKLSMMILLPMMNKPSVWWSMMTPLPMMMMVQNKLSGCGPWWSPSLRWRWYKTRYGCDPWWLPSSWWRWYKTSHMFVIYDDSLSHDEDGTNLGMVVIHDNPPLRDEDGTKPSAWLWSMLIPLPMMKMLSGCDPCWHPLPWWRWYKPRYDCDPCWPTSPWWRFRLTPFPMMKGTKPAVWLWSMIPPRKEDGTNPYPYGCDPWWSSSSWWTFYKTIWMVVIHDDFLPHDEDGAKPAICLWYMMTPLPMIKMVQKQPYVCDPWWLPIPWWRWYKTSCMMSWPLLTPVPMMMKMKKAS